MKDVPRHPHISKRKGSLILYFRKRIPLDLVEHYGKKEIKRSLKTSDWKVAREKADLESLKLEQKFAAARRELEHKPVTQLSALEIERLAALHHHQLLQEDEESRFQGIDGHALLDNVAGALLKSHAESNDEEPLPETPWEEEDIVTKYGLNERERLKLQETIEWVHPALRQALARGDVSLVIDEVDELLESNKVDLSRESEAYHQLAISVLRTRVEVADKIEQRQAGKVVLTPPEPEALKDHTAEEGEDGPTFSQIFDRYIDERKPTAKTEADFRAYVRRFNELHGDLPVTKITKAHVRDFKDAMLRFPSRPKPKQRALTTPQLLEFVKKNPDTPCLSPRTVNDKALGAIGAVLSYASRNGYTEYNVAAGIKVEASKVSKTVRLPYSVEDMNKIFRFPIYSNGDRPRGGRGEAAYWLPLLAAFTGARLEELGQLTAEDVKKSRGVTFLDMTTIADGKHLKTESSKRRVPLHDTLHRLGFMDYLKKVKRGRLFPELPEPKSGNPLTESWSKWWGRYARQHGGFDKLKVFHSFRHAAKDAFREGDVTESLRDALMGHAPRTEGERYGSGYSLVKLNAGMQKLKYPGLDLDHLKKGKPNHNR